MLFVLKIILPCNLVATWNHQYAPKCCITLGILLIWRNTIPRKSWAIAKWTFPIGNNTFLQSGRILESPRCSKVLYFLRNIYNLKSQSFLKKVGRPPNWLFRLETVLSCNLIATWDCPYASKCCISLGIFMILNVEMTENPAVTQPALPQERDIGSET